jgi:hypothetical protein
MTRRDWDGGLCADIQPQSGYYVAEQLWQVIGALITIHGDVHEVFLFFHHSHPLVDYKIRFALKNVSDLFPVPRVQEAQYPTEIRSSWLPTASVGIRDFLHGMGSPSGIRYLCGDERYRGYLLTPTLINRSVKHRNSTPIQNGTVLIGLFVILSR